MTRRHVIKALLAFCAGMLTIPEKIALGIRAGVAASKRILLPKNTRLSEIKYKDPKDLDTSLLDTTSIRQFGVMGQTDYTVDLQLWKLRVSGEVDQPLELSYRELHEFPPIERNILLICYGFFAYNGFWKGVASKALLEAAGVKNNATHIEFAGPEGIRGKSKEYPIEEVLSGKVFLAYQVNGQPLPEAHGFPLRVVAEDYYGKHWVKYVCEMRVLDKTITLENTLQPSISS